MEKLKIGIIGFGKHGSHYVRRYLETSDCKDVKLVAIAENNPAKTGPINNQFHTDWHQY